MPDHSQDPTFDFALLRNENQGGAARNPWPGLWLLGFLALVVASVVALVLYLQHFETEEDARRQAADAQWLEQSVQFHFRRLEEDLRVAARQSVDVQGGLLWREPGVLLDQGWVGAVQTPLPSRWLVDERTHVQNAQALATMQATTRGLRRSAYAGPMLEANGAITDTVWLAVPYFERGQFVGNYVAELSLNQAVRALVPDWFSKDHTVRLVLDEGVPSVASAGLRSYRAAMNLAGSDVFLEVTPVQEQPATVPRMFLLVAMVFLGGMLVSLWALRRDIVKRQQVQAHLQAEVALRTAMENSVTIGLRAWDLGGKVLYVNEAFCRMVGYAAQELVGESAPMPYWPQDHSRLQQVHDHILEKGTQGQGIEVQFQHRSGHLIDVLIHEAPLHAADGTHLGWMSSVLDISERKRAQRLAAQQQERVEATGRLVAVGEVASTLAHELNQPLGALNSFATGLLNRLHAGSISPQETVPVITRMAGLAEKAGRIIQRVNAIARRREISLQRLDLVAVLQRVVPTGIDAAGPVWIEADELLLEHLVNNLVGNAQESAAQGSGPAQVQVRVQADTARQVAVLSVADSGAGVHEEDREHVFEAFYSTKDGGMGMGLAICRSIVEAHHGQIAVDRDPVLGGARFTVELPLAAQYRPEADTL
ncbi:PAS domain S-box protein [Rhodoferax saidenbachensis]|uniref:histidine kinase n=1 Tax=Rhodoferax saidenbachensis TaxID=1484693 RepID=A0ABU1ZPK4_9BURK|nr:PAS domain S-box protein [Rhodoferax saidenbachensis]MDR7307470.1 two-component system sensor histidine kinase DctS [Rhodoferax saidenbachensis]